MSETFPFRHVLITGAGGSLGRALSRRCAQAGARLSLNDLDGASLAATEEECQALGSTVAAAVVDVCDSSAMRDWIERCDRSAPVDLVIVNAGWSRPPPAGVPMEELTDALRIVATNLGGVVNTVGPAIARMVSRGSGQIGLISSLAGYSGLPRAPVYAATKAGVRILGRSLRANLCHLGVGVSVICPGFFASGMTKEPGRFRPGLLTADAVACQTLQALAKNRASVAFPSPLSLVSRLLGALPAGFADLVARRVSTCRPSLARSGAM